ncbi:MAG: hypothetical protein PVI90_01895 [Desulfobacteraceae bacterium]
MEFIDNLKSFPDWTKTEYYSTNLDLYCCETNKKITKEEMQSWMINWNQEEKDEKNSDKIKCVTDTNVKIESEDTAFKLNQYEIIKKSNGQILWNSYKGPNKIKSGDCTIIEDILFLKSFKNRAFNQTKEQFFAKFQDLPKWTQTKYYCPKFSLHECKTTTKVQREKKIGIYDEKAMKIDDFEKGYENTDEIRHIRSEHGQVKSTPSHEEKTHFSNLNSKNTGSSHGTEMFNVVGYPTWLISAAVLMLFTIILFLAIMFNYSIKYGATTNYPKNGHHFSHRSKH